VWNSVINETEKYLLMNYFLKRYVFSMSPKQSGALYAVEEMLNGSLKRLNNLKGENRKALYDEYKEWLDLDDNNKINDGVLYCNYLG
tara:strand:+ start:240 stop:500 length:261 start_codon:yes stop_codon:yes gene_type:complete